MALYRSTKYGRSWLPKLDPRWPTQAVDTEEVPVIYGGAEVGIAVHLELYSFATRWHCSSSWLLPKGACLLWRQLVGEIPKTYHHVLNQIKPFTA